MPTFFVRIPFHRPRRRFVPSAAGGSSVPRTTADAPSTSDALVRTLAEVRTTANSTSTSDALTRSQVLARTAADSASTSDAGTWLSGQVRTHAGAPSTSDAVTRSQTLSRTAADTPTTSDAVTRTAVLARTTTGAPTTSDAAVGSTGNDPAAYRSHSLTTYASRTNTTITAPAGIADGDLLLLFMFNGGATPATPTLPAGFTLLSGYPSTVTHSGVSLALRVAYKLAASESGSYVVTHAAGSSQGMVVCVSGWDGSVPAGTVNTGTGTTTTATGLTTTGADSLVLFFGQNWDGYNGTSSPPAGTTPTFTEREDNSTGGTSLMYLATGELASAGATGNKTHTNPNVAANPWQGVLIAAESTPAPVGPVAAITSPVASASAWNTLTVAGTAASDTGTVTLVEVSTDGSTWFTATGTTSWSYTLPAQTSGSLTIYARATDDSPDTGDPDTVTVTVYAFGATTQAENALSGTSLTANLFSGMGTATTQGFARGFSFERGDTVQFPGIVGGSQVTFQLFRLGYYGGSLARTLGTITGTPAVQPAPVNDSNTRSQNCLAWTSVASWTVPSDARPGMYMAKMYRTDATSEGCNILFCVRAEGAHDVGYLTADFTWHCAYTAWGTGNTRAGGRSLYGTNDTWSIDADRAARGYFDRPVTVRGASAGTLTRFWRTEMAAIAFLERNGYDVGYTTCKDTSESDGATILGYFDTLFIAGHNEYWSQEMRDRIETRVNAGMNLFSLSGNTCFWRVLYDSTNRYIECWKETENASAKIGTGGQTWGLQPTDSSPPSLWTGTWRDNAALATADPENALLNNIFVQNNDGNNDVSFARSRFQNHRAWANTTVAGGSGTQTFTDLLGFEVDTYKMPTGQGIDSDLVTLINAARPPGTVVLTYQAVSTTQLLLDDGDGYGSGTYDYGFTLRKTTGGGIVFTTGSMNSSWGLYNFSDGDAGDVTSTDFKQFAVNVLAEMGAQPASIEGTLTTASASGDMTGPTTDITSHSPGTTYLGHGTTTPTITGTASTTGGTVAGIEWSLDGTTWTAVDPSNPASWSFTATLVNGVANTLYVRGVDDWGNAGTPDTVTLVTQTAPRTTTGAPSTSDAVTRTVVTTRTATDAPSTSDTATRTITFARTTANSTSTSDAVTGIKGRSVTASQSSSTSDAVTRIVVTTRTTTDTPTISDATTRNQTYSGTLADSPNTADAVAGISGTSRTTTDSPSTADTLGRLYAPLRTVNDLPTTADAVGRLLDAGRLLADTSNVAGYAFTGVPLPAGSSGTAVHAPAGTAGRTFRPPVGVSGRIWRWTGG